MQQQKYAAALALLSSPFAANYGKPSADSKSAAKDEKDKAKGKDKEKEKEKEAVAAAAATSSGYYTVVDRRRTEAELCALMGRWSRVAALYKELLSSSELYVALCAVGVWCDAMCFVVP